MKGNEYVYPFYKLAKEFHLPTEPLFDEKYLYLEELPDYSNIFTE